MSRRKRQRKGRMKADLNVVPYIDVMLVLLVIFMVSTPLIQQSSIKIDLPKNSAQKDELLSESGSENMPLILTVSKEGEYFLNRGDEKKPLSADEIINLTREAYAQVGSDKNNLAVLVQGDAAANYAKIIEGIAILQRAGAEKVGLVTEPGKNEAQESGEAPAADQVREE